MGDKDNGVVLNPETVILLFLGTERTGVKEQVSAG